MCEVVEAGCGDVCPCIYIYIKSPEVNWCYATNVASVVVVCGEQYGPDLGDSVVEQADGRA